MIYLKNYIICMILLQIVLGGIDIGASVDSPASPIDWNSLSSDCSGISPASPNDWKFGSKLESVSFGGSGVWIIYFTHTSMAALLPKVKRVFLICFNYPFFAKYEYEIWIVLGSYIQVITEIKRIKRGLFIYFVN